MTIEIDSAGYPTDESLKSLAYWDGPITDVPSLLDALVEAFNATGYGMGKREGDRWRFVTGGWSGCEEMLEALPKKVWWLAWESSSRGGAHEFEWRLK